MVGHIKHIHFKGEHSCISKFNNIHFDYQLYKYRTLRHTILKQNEMVKGKAVIVYQLPTTLGITLKNTKEEYCGGY